MPATAAPIAPSFSSGETNRPPATSSDDVGREQAVTQRLAALASPRPLRRRARPCCGRSSGSASSACLARRAASSCCAAQPHLAARPLLALVARTPSALRRSQRARRSARPASSIRRSAPSWRSPATWRKRTVARSLASGLRPGPRTRAAGGRRSPRCALGVGRRVDDPERRRRRVLGRARRVGVERVALVEKRVDQVLERRVHADQPRLSTRSASTARRAARERAASKVGSPRSVRRAASRCDGLAVERDPAAERVVRQSIIRRQTSTGIRIAAEQSHGIWSAAAAGRRRPRRRGAVEVEAQRRVAALAGRRSTSPRRPRGRRCRGRSSSNSVLPVKAGHQRVHLRPAEVLWSSRPSARARRRARPGSLARPRRRSGASTARS